MRMLPLVRRLSAPDARLDAQRSFAGLRTASKGVRGSHSKASAAESAAVLRELQTVLQTDPAAATRLGSLLSPSTTRGLTKALGTLQRTAPRASAAETGTTSAAVVPPSWRELKLVALQQALPFVGFGFVDNLIMIVAGDYIDLTLGISLGISSMAAAGIGNTISDVAGLGLGNVIEDFCARLGVPTAVLTNEQMLLRQTRLAKVVGSSTGVVIGCLLGMVPLLFLETREAQNKVETSETSNSETVAAATNVSGSQS